MLTEINVLHETLLARPRDAHKGTFGTVLVVGGSSGMSGAVTLSGRASLRGGAGLTRVAVPAGIQPIVAAAQAEYTTVALSEDADGRISERAWEEISRQAELAGVVAVGPGMGQSEGLAVLVRRVWTELGKPVILDADGLNLLAKQFPSSGGEKSRIITPHPGEFSRLSGVSAHDPDAQRNAAVLWAKKHQCVVVLKGAGTLVTDGEFSWRNTTGNPGMATGGSGDVLTGLMAAIVAQLSPHGISCLDAVRLAVYLHGKAGDLAAAEIGEVSLTAGDVIRFLPAAIKKK